MMKKQIITIAGGGSTYTPGIVQAILNNENGCHYLKYVYMILMKKEIWICT